VNEESIRENPKFLFSISMRSGTPLVHIHIHLDAWVAGTHVYSLGKGQVNIAVFQFINDHYLEINE
jgi:hypothetical protein